MKVNFSPFGAGIIDTLMSVPDVPTMSAPGYEALESVLNRAFEQAAHGKGKERHACGRPFTEQPMQTISELLGSSIGLQYQAIKKVQESNRLERGAQVRELLGAINYIAGAVIFLEAQDSVASEGKLG